MNHSTIRRFALATLAVSIAACPRILSAQTSPGLRDSELRTDAMGAVNLRLQLREPPVRKYQRKPRTRYTKTPVRKYQRKPPTKYTRKPPNMYTPTFHWPPQYYTPTRRWSSYSPTRPWTAARDRFTESIFEETAPPAEPLATTEVTRVDPSMTVLPENLARFHLSFSAAMTQEHTRKHVHVLDSSGREIDGVFLEPDEDAWNTDGTRLTLTLAPGRLQYAVKRSDYGPVVEQRTTYTLVIDSDWLDAEGTPLRSGLRHIFHVGPPDRLPPDPETWLVAPPRGGSTMPVTVTVSELLDHTMLHRALSVTDANGNPVPGSIKVESKGTLWRFTPRFTWQRGTYHIVVDPLLEDLAGNAIGGAEPVVRPFDVQGGIALR